MASFDELIVKKIPEENKEEKPHGHVEEEHSRQRGQ